MNELKEAFWQDYKDVDVIFKSSEVGSDNYVRTMEEKDKIRNELIKIEQIEAENNREKIRNMITVGTFGVSTVVGVWTVVKTFKFDHVATVTSTLGRNILNGALPKMFKR